MGYLLGENCFQHKESRQNCSSSNAFAQFYQGQWKIHSIFHSSCRIFIECAIGELVMQWVIFWQKIAFSTRKVGRIVQAAMLLHNFIVNKREQLSSEATIDRNFFKKFEYDKTERNRQAHSDAPNALVLDNEEPKPKGRQDKRKEELKETSNCNIL